jgi:CubicO group peptidase (beta-lactamase class C family)
MAGLLSACADGAATEDARPSAGGQWQESTPGDLGLDARVLERLAATARKARSKCLLVARDGQIAGEWYFDGTDAETTHPVFSVTKSVTSTLVGIAQDDGDLDVTRPAATWIPDWRGTPSSQVNVQNLLSNDSGREWSPQIDYSRLVGSEDMTAFAVGLDQAARPGTTWAYNNSAIQTLEPVLEQATGQDVATFARERLFAAIGMDHTFMGRDGARNTMTYSGVTSTCRDLARFGVLMLEGGRWDGRQVVSRRWVEAATGRPSTRLNAAYGLLWWLNHRGLVTGPLSQARLADLARPSTSNSTRRGRYVPGAPEDVFWAVGLGGQVVQVDPATGTVVVRLGEIVRRDGPGSFGPRDTARVLTEGVLRR